MDADAFMRAHRTSPDQAGVSEVVSFVAGMVVAVLVWKFVVARDPDAAAVVAGSAAGGSLPVWCGRRVLRCGVLRVRWCRRRCGMSVSVAGVGVVLRSRCSRWWMWLRGRGRDPRQGPEHTGGHQFRRGWSVMSVDDWDGLPPIAERLNEFEHLLAGGVWAAAAATRIPGLPTMSPPFVPSITG